ncbi:MAG: CDP-glucose 4,6-dehydratase [Candidatus Micrarchaeia archaeon]
MASLGGFFKGKRVLVTGNTGFKGSWLSHMLLGMGADVLGYSLWPDTKPNMFSETGLDKKMATRFSDIRDLDSLLSAFREHRPEIVFHLAAQPLVRQSYSEPRYTFDANLMGTVNVLECMRQQNGVKSAVLVTTDKVYKPSSGAKPHMEGDELGGDDPYSASKACCELAIHSYRKSFFQGAGKRGQLFASARAGNVVGGGDWSEDRLVPDIVRSRFGKAGKLTIRNPDAVRPWQHVLDPLTGYLLLSKGLYEGKSEFAGAWNFAPQAKDMVSVRQILSIADSIIGKASYDVVPDASKPETKILSLDAGKAISSLGWEQKIRIKQALEMTFEWYGAHYSGKDCAELTLRQISGHAR